MSVLLLMAGCVVAGISLVVVVAALLFWCDSSGHAEEGKTKDTGYD